MNGVPKGTSPMVIKLMDEKQYCCSGDALSEALELEKKNLVIATAYLLKLRLKDRSESL